MKKAAKIVGIGLLTLLYCFAMSTVSDFPSPAASPQPAPEEGNRVSVSSAGLFCLVAGSESSLKTSSNTPSTSIKNSFKRFSATLKSAELLIANQFSQYVFLSHNLPIRSRKSNVIFPFHYFW